MFQVNWSAKTFGFIGIDIYVDDKLQEQIPTICELLSKQYDERVFYKITEL